jgi:hypothetical protein
MKKVTLTVFFLSLALALAGPAAAVVVDFDSIPTGGNTSMIPAGYAGFTWDTNFDVNDNGHYNSWGNTVTFPSSPNAASNSGGRVLTVSASHTPFTLNGAYFSYWALNDGFWVIASAGITVTGYNSGNPVGSVHVSLTNNFVYSSIGLANIDTVTFTTDEGEVGHWWLMDNMTYNAVPIPGAVWLLGSGLAGLAFYRRRWTASKS